MTIFGKLVNPFGKFYVNILPGKELQNKFREILGHYVMCSVFSLRIVN